MKRKNYWRVIFWAKMLGLTFGVSLFLFFFNATTTKADSPYIVKHGAVFQGAIATSNYARVIKVDSTYHLWYEDSTAETLYHTTSADGENWNAEQLCDITNVHEPSVVWDETAGVAGEFKIWYESLEAGHEGEIWYAESSNGINWEGRNGDPIQAVTFAENGNSWEDSGRYIPYVIKDGIRYKMWYQSSSAAEPGDKRINYATSDDGTFWDNSEHFGQVTFGGNTNNNIVLAVGGAGEWDEGGIYSQAIINIEAELDGDPVDIFLMLYGGLSAIPGDFYKIGAVGSPDGVEWWKDGEGHVLSSNGDGNIWFPSMVASIDESNLENSFLQIWYMKGDSVHYATLGNIMQQYLEDQEIDEHGGVQHDRYEHYKKEYKSEKNKERYFSIRQIRRESPAFFWELRSIYLQYKTWSDEEINNLPLEIQEKFKLYEGYHGYKRYRELKEDNS